jgi:ribonuclease HII
MVAMDAAYPGYGFAAHKGYGVPAHIQALKSLGPCALHRTCWRAVQAAIAGKEIDALIQA